MATGPQAFSVVAAVLAHGERVPDRKALVSRTGSLTYGELRSAAARFAGGLRQHGVLKGDRVLLAASNTIDFVVAYVGTHLAAAVACPFLPQPRAASCPEEQLIAPRITCVNRKEGVNASRVVTFEELMAAEPVLIGDFPHPENVADILFTSGSTGQPKGVLLSHANLLVAARHIQAFVQNTELDFEVLALPFHHSFGLGRLRSHLVVGGTVGLLAGFVPPGRVFQALEDWAATGFSLVPGAWSLIRQMSGAEIGRFASQLKYLEIGSSSMPREDKLELMRLLPQTRICMHYGSTEASRSAFIEFHESAEKLDTIGRPAPGVTMAVLDEAGNEVPLGESGMLAVRGPHVSPGYWPNQPGNGGSWRQMGDVGRIDSAGYIELLGRTTEVINVGGNKVFPAEVENLLRSHPAVSDCACRGIPDAVTGERVVAFVVLSDASQVTALTELTHAKLASYKVPARFVCVSSIPRNALGKPDRKALTVPGPPTACP